MSKKKKHKPTPQVPRPSRPLPTTALAEALSLVQHERWPEAARALEELIARAPDRPEILMLLAQVYQELGDATRVQSTCERLLRIQPDNPDVTLALAGSYITTFHPALALRTLRRLLERWPEHREAAEARKSAAVLEATVSETLEQLGLSGEEGMELAIEHEQMQGLIAQRRFDQARRAGEDLLRRRPDFVPALNNLSLVHAAEGSLSQAIADARRALDLQPENYHALSNLVRFLCLSGAVEEAREWAARLKTVRSDEREIWVKTAEAFSYLGDDDGVLEAFQAARQAGEEDAHPTEPFLYHLAAVATMRRGDESTARRHWQRALQLNPRFELARANLDDLRKPVGERHAPWPFPLNNWMSQGLFEELQAKMSKLRVWDDEGRVTQVTRRFLRDHPEVAALVPALLDRGDPEGREWALRLASLVREPTMLAALRDFALSQRGPDELRHQAAQVASQAGLIPAGPVQIWTRGEWREILLMNFEVYDEPVTRHGPAIERLAEQAHDAMMNGRPTEAERLLEKALETEPDAPDLLNNLAISYQMQRRYREAEQLVRRIYESHPDYLFGRIGMALLATKRKEYEEARSLLLPVLQEKRLHFSEFAALCQAQMDLLLAEGKLEAARQWFDMWEQISPDHPFLDRWRARVHPPAGHFRWRGR